MTSVPLNRKGKETKMCGQPHQGLAGVFLPGFVQFLTDSGSCVETCRGGLVTENYGCPWATPSWASHSPTESLGSRMSRVQEDCSAMLGPEAAVLKDRAVCVLEISFNIFPQDLSLTQPSRQLRLWIYLEGNFLPDGFIVESIVLFKN